MAIISLLTDSPELRRHIVDSLPDHRLLPEAQDVPPADPATDLIICDRPCLHRHAKKLARLAADTDRAFLPVLLIDDAPPTDFSPADTLADDALPATPPAEDLNRRIATLLRLRDRSHRELAARQTVQHSLAGVNRAYRALGACNEALVHAREEGELLTRVCRSIVEVADYCLAWVGFAMPFDEKPIHIVASSDDNHPYLEGLYISWGDNRHGRAPTGRAIRSGNTHVSNNIAEDPTFEPWREKALHHGFASSIALPLRINGRICGALCIYAGDTHAFDDAEIALLQRLTGNLVYGIEALRDQELRRFNEERANFLAYRDPLTFLANRTQLTETLAKLSPETGPAALLFLDLDGFKVVNDALGHDVGDELLCQLARRVEGVVRREDLVVRHGGDEFIILAFEHSRSGKESSPPDPTREDWHGVLAERILDTLREPFTLRGSEYHIGVSMGISLFPGDSRTGSNLLTQADSAMYAAKADGGNRYCYYSPQMCAAQQQRLNMNQQLHAAVKEREFRLHYQPILHLETGRVMALEALLRWQRADGSWVPPADFIPLAEDNGMIMAIGDWVLEEAIRTQAALARDGHDLTMRVNLSVVQFQQPDFASHLITLVDRLQGDPRKLILEVTESGMSQDPERLEHTVGRLCRHGFGLSIDDFGTGYSSLGRLSRMDVQSLKIDKSFLQRIPGDTSAEIVVTTVLQLACAMDLEVVAEGIEQSEQLEFLRHLGCGFGQGYLFARPVALEALPGELERLGAGQPPIPEPPPDNRPDATGAQTP